MTGLPTFLEWLQATVAELESWDDLEAIEDEA